MKNGIKILLLYLFLFTAFFIITFFDFVNNKSTIDIGLPAKMTDIILLIMSLIGIVKTVWHIYSY